MINAFSVQSAPEDVQEALRTLEGFQAGLPANDQKIENVIEIGRALADQGVFPVEKILAKCEQLNQR